MATTPRSKGTPGQTTRRAKKPATIDLAANEVNAVPPATTDKADSVDKPAKVTTNPARASSRSSKSASDGTPSLKSQASDKSSTDATTKAANNIDSDDKNTKTPPAKTTRSAATTNTDAKKPDATKKAEPNKSVPPSIPPQKSTANTTGANTTGSSTAKNLSANQSTSGNGFGKLAGAGIVGGIVALIGAGAMQYSGLLPGAPTNTQNSISTDNLNGENAVPVPAIDLAPLQEKVALLQQKMDSLDNVAPPIVDLSPIENRITALEKIPTNSGSAKDVENLENQLSSVKSELANLQGSASKMTARLRDIGSATPDLTATNNMIDDAIAPLIELSNKTTIKLGEIERKFAMLTTKIDEEVEARIDGFDEKLKNAATGEKLARSVAINALKAAVENGEPYSAALTSLETLNGTSEPLEVLRSSALTGVASSRILVDEFHEMQSSILLAATSGPEAGLSDKLMSSIRSLVTVTSNEPLPGDSPEAIVSRVDVNLKAGNLDAANAEWNTLPQQAKQVSKSWAEKLTRTIEANQQVSKLIQSIQTDDTKSGS